MKKAPLSALTMRSRSFCGTLKENVFTTSPAETKYILEPNDGATTGMLEEFSNSGEKFASEETSLKRLVQVVKRLDKINKRFENLCGVVQAQQILILKAHLCL